MLYKYEETHMPNVLLRVRKRKRERELLNSALSTTLIFAHRMKSAEKQYLDAFQDELSGFKGRVMQRAKVRIEEATRALEEEERKKRLGPGGLDPVEVMETLPQALQECFASKSVAKLQEVIASLPKEEASYHMKRCVDSGLWVPDAKAAGVLYVCVLESGRRKRVSADRDGGERKGER